MNINRKYIIIFGTLILLLVVIFGGVTYYNERKLKESTQVLSKTYHTAPTFDQNYPISFEEADSFQKFCAVTATPSFMSSMASLLNEEFIEEDVLANRCILIQEKDTTDFENKYMPAFSLLKEVPVLQESQYIAIAVNLGDLLKKNNSFISPKNNFNLCIISDPVLVNPFKEQLLQKDQINVNRSIVLSDGEAFCSKFSSLLDETQTLLISGFVPKTDIFQAKIYLILEDETVDNLLSQESFSNIEDILQSCPLLWNVEKPVI